MKKPDLLGYLEDKFNEMLKEEELEVCNESRDVLNAFIAFCRHTLKDNPAVSTCPLDQGIGLRLADKTEVALAEYPSIEPLRQVMPITGMSGPTNITDGSCVHVFGKTD